MPTSHAGQINTIVDLLVTIDPKSILDIGIGYGKYGFLSREYLDIASDKEVYNKRTVRIDGIEAFPDYVTNLQKEIYDNIYIGDATSVIQEIKTTYDLILLMDVFEHFTQPDGERLLKSCLQKSKFVLISCPKHVLEQGSEYGNVYETHRFNWKRHHFNGMGEKVFIPNYYSLIVLFGKEASQIKWRRWRKLATLKFFSRFPFLASFYRTLKGLVRG